MVLVCELNTTEELLFLQSSMPLTRSSPRPDSPFRMESLSSLPFPLSWLSPLWGSTPQHLGNSWGLLEEEWPLCPCSAERFTSRPSCEKYFPFSALALQLASKTLGEKGHPFLLSNVENAHQNNSADISLHSVPRSLMAKHVDHRTKEESKLRV